jgi:acetyl-CoA decarbonylase/synthase complex subunit beta
VDGFHGVSIEYMRSPKFLKVEGGWTRIVWMPASVKERVKDFIPKEIIEKIPTENDVKTIDELKTFLKEKEHPVVERWKEKPVEVVSEIEEAPMVPIAEASTMPITAGGFRIILKDAKIYAKRVIIRSADKK